MSSSYLQRLLDRSAGGMPSIPLGTVAVPAAASASPIAQFDQRLNDPDLAAHLGFGSFAGMDAEPETPVGPWSLEWPARSGIPQQPVAPVAARPGPAPLIEPASAAPPAIPPAARPRPTVPVADPMPAAPLPALAATQRVPAAPGELPDEPGLDGWPAPGTGEPAARPTPATLADLAPTRPTEPQTAVDGTASLPAEPPPPWSPLESEWLPTSAEVAPAPAPAPAPGPVLAEPAVRPVVAVAPASLASDLDDHNGPLDALPRLTGPPPAGAAPRPSPPTSSGLRVALPATTPEANPARTQPRAVRPMTAAEASVIGPLSPGRRSVTVLGTRRR